MFLTLVLGLGLELTFAQNNNNNNDNGDPSNNYMLNTHGEVAQDEFQTVARYLIKTADFLNAKTDSVIWHRDSVLGYRMLIGATDDLIFMQVSESRFRIEQITYELDLQTYQVKAWHTDLRLDLGERKEFVSLLDHKNDYLFLQHHYVGMTKKQIMREKTVPIGLDSERFHWKNLTLKAKLGKFIGHRKLVKHYKQIARSKRRSLHHN